MQSAGPESIKRTRTPVPLGFETYILSITVQDKASGCLRTSKCLAPLRWSTKAFSQYIAAPVLCVNTCLAMMITLWDLEWDNGSIGVLSAIDWLNMHLDETSWHNRVCWKSVIIPPVVERAPVLWVCDSVWLLYLWHSHWPANARRELRFGRWTDIACRSCWIYVWGEKKIERQTIRTRV